VKLTLTIGRGVKRPQGKRVELVNGSACPRGVVLQLQQLGSGDEEWWSPHSWTNAYRLAKTWESSMGIAVDVDYAVPDQPPTADDVAQLRAIAWPGSAWHLTPHGARVVFAFGEDCSDRELVLRAAQGAGELVRTAIAGTRYFVDPKPLEDFARLFFAPRALAKGVQRNDVVLELRADPYLPAELAHAAPTPKPEATTTPATSRAPVTRGHRTMQDAMRAWNDDHPRTYPRHSSKCPVCGDKGSFGHLPDDPKQWFCWSTDHPDLGIKGASGYHGDALDLEAHERGCKPVDVLRADGYLQELRPKPASVTPIDTKKRKFGDYREFSTDAANGAKFAEMHGERFRYLVDRKTWLEWDGLRWADAPEGALLRAGKETSEELFRLAIKEVDLDQRKKLVKHAIESANKSKLRSMITLASSEVELEATVAELDAQPDLLNCVNGTVNLRTGELHAHRRGDLTTKLTGLPYEPKARCPRWEQFMLEVFAGDAELASYVQRAVGYSLTGHTREQAFFVLHGGGRNGKGRFIRQLRRLIGDAGKTTQFATLTADRNKQQGNTPELAALFGARVVTAGEPDKGVRLSESVIKSLTGEDEITVCNKFEAPFSFIPLFKLWLHVNHKPEIRGTDNGIWRRPKLIPFNVSFEGRADLALDDKLDAEGPGILAWAILGAREWYAHGLGSAAAVAQATASYREESDPIGPFIEDTLVRRDGAFVSSKALYAAYESWCQRNGVEPWKPQTLSKELVSRGFKSGRADALVRGFSGLELVMTGDRS